ncbi:MAG: hypothetical protein LLG04_18235 [Parachlamydia sp.]|nr:hypothetical protein [Parachlamydia sp.]
MKLDPSQAIQVPFHQRVQGLVTLAANETCVRRQLWLLAPGVISRVKDAAQTAISYVQTVPINKACKHLSTRQKTVALVQSLGVAMAYTLLGLMCPERDKPLVKDLEEFQKEVDALTNGVATVYQLDAFRVLRMLLFGSLGRCVTHENGNKVSSELLKNQLNQCHAIFSFINGRLENESLNDLQGMSDLVVGVDSALFAFKTYLEKSNNKGQVQKDVQRILQILQLMKKAISKPDLFLPLLMEPIQFQPLRFDADANDAASLDFYGMHMARAKEWMRDFLESWRLQSEAFYPMFEEVLKGQGKWDVTKGELNTAKDDLKKFFDKYAGLLDQIDGMIEVLEHFEHLSPDEQQKRSGIRDALLARCKAIIQDTYKLDAEYTEIRKTFNRLIDRFKVPYKGSDPLYRKVPNINFVMNSRFYETIHYPYHYAFALSNFVVNSIQSCCQLNAGFHDLIKRVSSTRFESLNSVSLVDLLDLELRSAFWNWREQAQPHPDDSQVHEIQEMFESILTEMRRHLALRKNLRGRTLDDLAVDEPYIDKAIEANKRAEKLQSQTGDPKLNKLLEIYQQLGECLSNILVKPEWPHFLKKSPFASEKCDSKLERDFHFELFSVLLRSFLNLNVDQMLQSCDSHLGKIINPDEKPFADAAKVLCGEISEIIKQAKARLHATAPRLADFQMDATAFLEEVTECATEIEDLAERQEILLLDYLKTHPDSSDHLKNVAGILTEMKEILRSPLLSSAKSLSNYLFVSELSAKEAASRPARQRIVKPKRIAAPHPPVVESVAPAPKAPQPKAPVTFTHLQEGFEAFRQCVGKLVASNQSFVPTSEEGLRRAAQLNEWSSTLSTNLTALEGMIKGFESYGDRPFFVAALYLKMGVCLEMVSKLIALNLHVPMTIKETRNALLHGQGRDYQWEAHSPYRYAKDVAVQLMRNARNMILSKAELGHFQKFERVVSLSSRYPVSGQDELSEVLDSLFANENGEDLKKQVKQTILGAFQASVALVTGSSDIDVQKEQRRPADSPLEKKQMQAAFHLVPIDPLPKEEWVKRVSQALSSLEQRLQRIQKYRCIDFNREVAYIDGRDRTPRQRQGTIHGALKDLAITLKLAESILLQDDDPALCQTLGEESILRQAVLLEQVLLVLLSHLPVPAQSGIHCLWDTHANERPLRYRHLIDLQATRLLQCVNEGKVQIPSQIIVKNLKQATKEKAELLTPVLQHLYRYPLNINCEARQLLDNWRTLSRLRLKMENHTLSVEEETILNTLIKDSNLDRHIVEVIRAQVKQPLLEMLVLVDQWLAVYEEQLKT